MIFETFIRFRVQGLTLLLLSQILKRYQDSIATDGKASMVVDETELPSAIMVGITRGRYLEGPDIEKLSLDDFMQLEKQLADALLQTRNRKAQLMLESVAALHEKERTLKQENEQLKDEVAKLMGNSNRGNHTDLDLNGVMEEGVEGDDIQGPQPAAILMDNSNSGNNADVDLNNVVEASSHIQCPQPVAKLMPNSNCRNQTDLESNNVEEVGAHISCPQPSPLSTTVFVSVVMQFKTTVFVSVVMQDLLLQDSKKGSATVQEELQDIPRNVKAYIVLKLDS
uniref:K-box domain-containing protein n=1 Tax=Chenopodium quinoa TaxID=63459 RepID=A0A803L1A4_CHEQI